MFLELIKMFGKVTEEKNIGEGWLVCTPLILNRINVKLELPKKESSKRQRYMWSSSMMTKTS